MSAAAAAAPSGVLTFLLTDVEGSTRRWETDADAMRIALAAHDDVLCKAIEAHGGWLFKHTGDGVCVPHSLRRDQRSTLRWRHSKSWNCRCGWVWRPAKQSCAERTTSVRC